MAKKDNGHDIPVNGHEAEEAEEAVKNVEATEEQGEAQELSLSEEELKQLCREHVCSCCDVMKEAEGERLRALADTENVKKRLQREAEDMKRYAADSVLGDMLPVLDNLDLALAHTDGLDDACKNFVMGVDMTRKSFLDALKNHGVERLEAAPGQEFDPEFMEAVGMAENPELPDGGVVQVVQAGYRLKGRLLRPVKVMVNKL